jgi:hypothetical protein
VTRAQQFLAEVARGDSLAKQGRIDAALAAYRQAGDLIPGHSAPFSRALCLTLAQMLEAKPARPPAPSTSARVQMSSLGSNGRFGNQLLQYGFLRLYATRQGLIAETPDWFGRYVYGCDDPLIASSLPVLDENSADFMAALRGELDAPPRNVDLRGYFCGNTRLWGPVAGEFRNLFQPVPAIVNRLDAALEQLRTYGRTLVALHLRRGDFGYGRFWIAPPSWYLRWLRGIWPQLDAPVLYIASDDSTAATAFAEFAPLQSHDLEASGGAMPLLLDHHVLSHADHLAISNSSFSFTAAMLNSGLSRAARPDPDQRELTDFDPWAAPVLLDPTVDERWRLAVESAGATPIGADQWVAYYGGYCSGWTAAVRSALPSLTVNELETGESLDVLCRQKALTRLHHQCLADEVTIPELISNARDGLSAGNIEVIHFGGARTDLQSLLSGLSDFGFRPLPSTEGALRCAILERSSSSMAAHGGTPGASTIRRFDGKLAMSSAHAREQPAYLIAGLYTANYRPLAERLAASLMQFGLPYALYEVPTVHRSMSVRGTDDPTYTKANFVQHLLDTHGVPILYLDSDCVIRSEPKLIRSLVEAGTEFAIYNWLADEHTDAYAPVELRGPDGQAVKPANRFFRFSHSIDAYSPTQLICSGATQLYANTPAARALLNVWAAVIDEHPGVEDDQCLDWAFNFRMPDAPRPKTQWLDKAYARYLFWIFSRPVIDHPQFPAGARPHTAPYRPLPASPRFRAELAETRVAAQLVPRDCFIDTQLKRLLRSQASRAKPGQMEAVDIGPLLQELSLG